MFIKAWINNEDSALISNGHFVLWNWWLSDIIYVYYQLHQSQCETQIVGLDFMHQLLKSFVTKSKHCYQTMILRSFGWEHILQRECPGVCEMTVKRTRLCYWIARPVKPGVLSSNTNRARLTVILHTPGRYRFYHCVDTELRWHLPNEFDTTEFL